MVAFVYMKQFSVSTVCLLIMLTQFLLSFFYPNLLVQTYENGHTKHILCASADQV